jgi:hypothetical protein
MTAMMNELGLKVTGGNEGTMGAFKDQITRFARCNFTFVRPGDTSAPDQIAVEGARVVACSGSKRLFLNFVFGMSRPSTVTSVRCGARASATRIPVTASRPNSVL